MKGRIALVLVLNMVLLSTGGLTMVSADEQPSWRSVGIDPTLWSDGPVEEDTPMNETYQGNAVFEIEVSYKASHSAARQEGVIVLELFEQWAPITTANMIKNVESGLYDGIFFHRVIDDFVTQSGDPTCKTFGVYPVTLGQCGGGGSGTTIPLEHDVNLSHVDGAIGMARGQEEDSADSQWYIAETEAHNLDPENREDGGYATFGIVRDGMMHVRNIAITPTSDDPTGDEDFMNPASSAGRPVYEVEVLRVEMVGVSDPEGTVRFGDQTGEEGGGLLATLVELFPFVFTGAFLFLLIAGIVGLYIARIDEPFLLEEGDSSVSLDAVLIDD
ncbi:MAG: hypothetical protein CMA63_07440 [Euryarchaeota archaeon]|nr:hypothetical protein [Euryarchaeota archaeon]